MVKEDLLVLSRIDGIKHDPKVPKYWIFHLKVAPSVLGRATIHDKDVLIYVISQLVEVKFYT